MSQRETPKTKGLKPTLRKVSRDNPRPIKNKVKTRVRRAILSTKPPTSWRDGIHVTSAAAKRKPRMNHGFLVSVFAPDVFSDFSFELFQKPITSATGTIQRARASFTVVPTSAACLP